MRKMLLMVLWNVYFAYHVHSVGWQDLKESAYYHDQTIVKTIHINDTLIDCEMFDVKTVEEKQAAFSTLQPLPVNSTQLTDMINLMESCLEIHRDNEKSLPVGLMELISIFTKQSTVSRNFIIPGTIWCGITTLAENYTHLGKDRHVDLCCRQHDHCPTKIDASQKRYGIYNRNLYPISHCDCDENMMECMRTTKSIIAKLIGFFFFNVLRIPCLEFHTVLACDAKRGEERCRNFTQEEKLVVVPTKRKF